MGKHESKIQHEADMIIKAAKTDMAQVIVEQPQHGPALSFYKGAEANIWTYDDKFKKTIESSSVVSASSPSS